mmetsp:Transcript_2352/g.6285  ORF Transcript_2352/g.6285 Transcript_2352/m.6285 type:complete len:253 (-) Transcript_2352:1139-1897(-)
MFSNFITLGPLYALSQPFAVIKSKWLYRTVEPIPAPKIEEVDDNGNVIRSKRKPARISLQRTYQLEGVSGLLQGWGARLLHDSLWRVLSVTGWELLLYAPGNSPWFVVSKLILSMIASSYIVHPLYVVETRTTAGVSGYGVRGLSGGMIRVLREDAAWAGAGLSAVLRLANGPVAMGYLPTVWAAAWTVLLYPLERAAARARLGQKPEEEQGGGVIAAFGDAAFPYYAAQVLVERLVAGMAWSALAAMASDA